VTTAAGARDRGTRAAVIAGIGGYVPGEAIPNTAFEHRLDTSDEWIRQRTGIGFRHFVSAGTATSDLAVAASRRALASAGEHAVDMVILATTTPDHPCPATAPSVASRLGLGPVPAFDVAAVCSGFLYALMLAESTIRSGGAERVLVVGADSFSTILDPGDRNTAVIFGDGAGAMVLRAGHRDEDGAVLATHLGSDGGQADLIMVPGGGSRERTSESASTGWNRYFTMQGKRVFEAAVAAMSESAASVMGRVGWTPATVDRLVAHQANLRILRSVSYRLGLPAERALVHLDRVGNTSAASIPLALADAAQRIGAGERMILTAFGGGTTWGAAAVTWPHLVSSHSHTGAQDDSLVS
jgi:3-oxoacyl-[acyl-carrier-protein] synthase-3